jgi:hypothetical protein
LIEEKLEKSYRGVENVVWLVNDIKLYQLFGGPKEKIYFYRGRILEAKKQSYLAKTG